MIPSLSVIIPTLGRPSLRDAIGSASTQWSQRDEIIVVADTYDGPVPEAAAIAREFGPRVRVLEYDAGHHCWGHCQINVGMCAARGDYLVFQDDDDEFADTAFGNIRAAAAETPGRPLMFRFITQYRYVVWGDPRDLTEGSVAGHGLVIPNVPARFGTWSCRYAGDWDFIRDTVTRWGGPTALVWRQEIISVARPTEREYRDGFDVLIYTGLVPDEATA